MTLTVDDLSVLTPDLDADGDPAPFGHGEQGLAHRAHRVGDGNGGSAVPSRTIAPATAEPSIGTAHTTTESTVPVGKVRPIQNPAGPESATTTPVADAAPERCRAARAGLSGADPFS